MKVILNNAVIRTAIEKMAFPDAAHGDLHLFGIRGASLAGPRAVLFHENRNDRWNDVIGVFGTDFGVWTATTDPGRFYTQHPTNAAGAAYLLPGRWRYMVGKHKGKPALVQAQGVDIRRDRDRDGRPTNVEPIFRDQVIGLNIHQGPKTNRPLSVYDWSAGCQVLPYPYWLQFWAALGPTPPRRGFWYYLLDHRGFE